MRLSVAIALLVTVALVTQSVEGRKRKRNQYNDIKKDPVDSSLLEDCVCTDNWEYTPTPSEDWSQSGPPPSTVTAEATRHA